jgi:ethanolamine utilization protein EutA
MGVPMCPHIKNQNQASQVMMIGLDFGTTTSSAMVAKACVGLSSSTGRMELGSPQVVYRSEPIFTPFHDENIDTARLNDYIDQWIKASGVSTTTIFAGGVIITGLAAKKANASELARLVGRRIGETVIAAADDPCLESWLSFMGSCSELSRLNSGSPFLNLDIGGGTTNPAFGINGEVHNSGCYFIGARHFQFMPGTYHLNGLSFYGKTLLEVLGISKKLGQDLLGDEIEAILDFYISALESIATCNHDFFSGPTACHYQQIPIDFESTEPSPVIVFSGGVGELVYRESLGKGLPGTTYYGDLGIDLARRITQSPILAEHICDLIPENQGRATVYGLTLHSTEISGQTIFLSDEELLPCHSLPIVTRLPIEADAEQISKAVLMAGKTVSGGCIQLLSRKSDDNPVFEDTDNPASNSLSKVKTFGQRLRIACNRVDPGLPVIILAPGNYGQALGNYASNWRQEPFPFIVIDEIPDRQAHFVNIGRLHNTIVPVSFYGIC